MTEPLAASRKAGQLQHVDASTLCSVFRVLTQPQLALIKPLLRPNLSNKSCRLESASPASSPTPAAPQPAQRWPSTLSLFQIADSVHPKLSLTYCNPAVRRSPNPAHPDKRCQLAGPAASRPLWRNGNPAGRRISAQRPQLTPARRYRRSGAAKAGASEK